MKKNQYGTRAKVNTGVGDDLAAIGKRKVRNAARTERRDFINTIRAGEARPRGGVSRDSA